MPFTPVVCCCWATQPVEKKTKTQKKKEAQAQPKPQQQPQQQKQEQQFGSLPAFGLPSPRDENGFIKDASKYKQVSLWAVFGWLDQESV